MPRYRILSHLTDKIDKETEAPCWVWSGMRNYKGYGIISNGRKQPHLRAHRVAWELVAGPIPFGMKVLHTCDNRACLRNDEAGVYEMGGRTFVRHGHLWLGTEADNSEDMVRKDRARPGNRNGEHSPSRRLSWESVAEIRAMTATGITQDAVAEKFGISQAMVSKVALGKAWKHLP